MRVAWNLKTDGKCYLGMITAYIVKPDHPEVSEDSVILEFGIRNGSRELSSRAGQLGPSYKGTHDVWDLSAFNRDQWNLAVMSVKNLVETIRAGKCFFMEGALDPVSDELLTQTVLEAIHKINKVVLDLVGPGDGE